MKTKISILLAGLACFAFCQAALSKTITTLDLDITTKAQVFPAGTRPGGYMITAKTKGGKVVKSIYLTSLGPWRKHLELPDGDYVISIQMLNSNRKPLGKPVVKPYKVDSKGPVTLEVPTDLKIRVYDIKGGEAAWIEGKSTSGSLRTTTSQQVHAGRGDSALSDVARALLPGEWAELGTKGFDNGKIFYTRRGTILVYADEAVWDNVRKKLLFLGAQHGGTPDVGRFLSYDGKSNAWKVLPLPDYSRIPVTHAYSMETLDPATGILYYRRHNTPFVAAYDSRSNVPSWSRILEDRNLWRLNSTCGLEYFPEMEGLIIYQATRKRLLLYRPKIDKLQVLAADLGPSTYHEAARYDPVYKTMFFGGGNKSRHIWQVNSEGRVTALPDSPVIWGITHTVSVVDPTSGNFLLFARGGGFYEYDMAVGKWKTRDTSTLPFIAHYDGHGVIAAPIRAYGVILFIVTKGRGIGAVYVYRHDGHR